MGDAGGRLDEMVDEAVEQEEGGGEVDAAGGARRLRRSLTGAPGGLHPTACPARV